MHSLEVGCAEEMCHRRRTRPQDGRRRAPHEGKKSAYNAGLLGEKDGEDALRRPQSTAEGGASWGGGAVGPRVAPEATVPAREQNRLTILREGEVRVPVAIAHTPEDVGHGP